ncbi:MAG: UbiX family flavin prenyltransferase [Saprospiraceae bacterium]|nr:UbiX family flavin prenyltransferase [Saprospiraceae bacterium]
MAAHGSKEVCKPILRILLAVLFVLPMKLVIGVGGASGSIYAAALLRTLHKMGEHTVELVFSENALTNWQLENPGYPVDSIPFRRYGNRDFSAGFASGSARYDAMIVCPCSAGLLGRIANGVSDDLMTRAADVMLKERRRLVLVFRETPLSLIHIENMERVTRAGAIVCPAIPSFYSQPSDLDALVSTVTDRALELCGVHTDSFRWGT